MNLALAYLGFFAAGLAGSLHCVGMCGPILAALAGADRSAALTIEGRGVGHAARRTARDLLWYHAGRICTYAMLGALAGSLGIWIRETLWLSRLQGWVGILAGAGAILAALLLARGSPSACSKALDGTTAKEWMGEGGAVLRSLAAQSTPGSRFLLGWIMGFLPCGLVYVMLAAVAALGHPLASALGMIAFGLGTLPALSGVVIAARLLPIRWRRHGNRAAAVMALIVGSMFVWRSWPAHQHAGPGDPTCPLCTPDAAAASNGSGDASAAQP